MEIDRIKKSIIIAFFVAISAQINLNILTSGFIVALSVLVMEIFVYCYIELVGIHIIFLSGIFSPLFRLAVLLLEGNQIRDSMMDAMPDIAFFFSFGFFFWLIVHHILREPLSIRNFPFVMFFCDVLSNVCEITCRSILAGHPLFTVSICTSLGVIALIRTIMLMAVIFAVESYSSFLVRREHAEEYRRLINQAATIEGELRVMEKNAAEVEAVMKKAYDLYTRSTNENYPPDVSNRILEIAKNTHEIKADYQNVLSVLRQTYLKDIQMESIGIEDLLQLERKNVLAYAKKHGYPIEVQIRIVRNFEIKDNFKMMSVLRNLLSNSADALGTKGGKISVLVYENYEDPLSSRDEAVIEVYDNGPGIPSDMLDTVFLDGYSTKFNEKTGNIQRGLGLSLVKDYVENDFQGRIEVESKEEEFTKFKIFFPIRNEFRNKELEKKEAE